MRVSSVLLGAAFLASTMLAGCSSANQDPPQSLQVTQAGYKGQEPGGLIHKTKEGLRDTTDALHITPKVKASIVGDAKLNDKRNLINVSTKDYVLHLTGHVYSNAIKARAGSVAAAKLKKMHKGNYKVSNELSVSH